MADVDEFQALKKSMTDAKAAADRAAGAYGTHMEALKTEFNVDSIEAAEALLVELQKQESELRRAYEGKLRDFEEKWGSKLV